MEIPKTYEPKEAEHSHYARWEELGCFAPEINKNPAAPSYCIVIPPPNVTGSLHMGHALQHTIMDILARWKRMLGYRTLWLPGTDHAGISTQLMVTRQLRAEGISRLDLGREKFIERVWEWKRQYGGEITKQMRREGASVDWSRERFTMDEGLSGAVCEVFVRLYDEGFVHRGPGLVNWCPTDQTVLSDLEVEKNEQKGKLYFLRYPVKDSSEHITVATTRPETMLGDTAVAVNPDDERFNHLVGKSLLLPLVNREIPVIADAYVDPAFGTGAVKITPAHDPNDYEMGLRHGLAQITVIGKDARMTAQAGPDFAGLDRFAARTLVIEKLEALELLEKIEDYSFALSQCERCKTTIEPLVLTQWFCRMAEMRALALGLLKDHGYPRFTPAVPYEKVYSDWLENLRDWTISRQLWWGHQIPAWYDSSGKIYVARTEADARAQAGGAELTRDADVLDTWFSSALWPFSTLGWPSETAALNSFYPTSVLVTARDIIFLWVSRMVMSGMKFVGQRPFDDVFVTGTVFGKDGKRMSKTRKNGVDPLEVFDKYGVDATRLVLASIGSTDTKWNDNAVEAYRNFANKIWNATRFCLMNSEGAAVSFELLDQDAAHLPLHDRWIVSRLNRTALNVAAALGSYAFHAAVQELYHFFWDDFCDWYIELAKDSISAVDATPQRAAARSRILTVLEQALRLLHPFMPYITEDLWQRLPGVGPALHNHAYKDAPATIMLANYLSGDDTKIDEAAEAEMRAVIGCISAVRSIRAAMNIKPAEKVAVHVAAAPELQAVLRANQNQIVKLARASALTLGQSLAVPKASARAVLGNGAELAIPLEGLIDFAQERARLTREADKLRSEADRLEGQLGNPQFAERAPREKVDELQARLAEIAASLRALDLNLEALV